MGSHSSYFPSIEAKYGKPVEHMEMVAALKADHGMGHGHANALVAHHMAESKQDNA